MATKVELPVALGLEDAISQAASLKKILNESVQPNTKGYNTILQLLEKIETAADGLKGKLSTAFQTSKSSNSFLKEYEKVLGMLDSVKDNFSNVNLADLILSESDAKTVEDYTKKIADLQTQITAISGGKIGGFFNLEEFKEAKNLLEQLQIDPSQLTFEGLAKSLTSEIDKIDQQMNALNNQFANAENIINNLGRGNLDNLNASLKQATENADGLIRKISGDAKIDINSELRRTFEALDGVDLKARYITADTDIDKFIKEETARIVEAYDARIADLQALKPKVDRATNDLLKQKDNAATLDVIKSDQIRDIFTSFNLKEKYDEFLKEAETVTGNGAQDLASKMASSLRTAFASMGNIEELKGWRDAASSYIVEIFESLGETTVAKAGPFRKALQEVFSANGIDIKSAGIAELINKIKEGDSVSTIIDNITKALESYIATSSKTPDNAKKYDELKDKLNNYKKALTEVNTINTNGTSSLEAKKQDMKDYNDQITTTRENARKGINVNVGSGDLEKGKDALDQFINSITKLERTQKALSNVQTAVTRWMGFYQVLNLTKRAINDMTKHVKELDEVMTKIAVVTNMTQSDLWNQIGTYSEIARQYGVAIKGVYEVSQLYYQQGLNKGDVMNLTTETLKMARIAGIDYATAADYMTTAVRGFKLEMTDAAHVTDVFSNLAAHTASSTEELAVAISKTAASAASVGASFEATSAMMSTMIATTRESATNIGTALKSIISRYGELKQNMNGTDAEGEAYSLNKVDTALQSVGISIHDAAGQFRNFDDVILELAEAWDTIDKNTQRYIATVMAGNRQQSRFLALVSNVEEYKRALDLANNSDDVGELQVLKTLDSVDAKIEKMKVTIQEFYTSSGIEQLYKGILDTITNVINAANDLPKAFGNIPATALAVGFQLVSTIKNLLTLIIASIQSGLERIKASGKNAFSSLVDDAGKAGKTAGENFRERFTAEMNKLSTNGKGWFTNALQTNAGKWIGSIASTALSTGAAALTLTATNAYGQSRSGDQDRVAAGSMFGAAALNGLSGFITGTMMSGNPLIGALNGVTSLLPSFISALSMHRVTLEREIELQTKVAQESKQKATQAKGEVKELEVARDKLENLQEASIESAEAMQEYKDYMNQLADTYPELISRIELTGDKTIVLADLEQKLADARIESANATIQSLKDEAELKNTQKKSYEKLKNGSGLPGSISTDNVDFSFLEQWIRSYGDNISKGNISDGNKYTALLDTYNMYAKEFGGTELVAETKDFYGNKFNEQQVMNNLAAFDQLQQYLLSGPGIAPLLKNQLKNSLSTVLSENKDLTLAELTQGKLKELSDLDNKDLNTEQLLEIIRSVHDKAQSYIDKLENSIGTINDTLNRAELQLSVDTAIGTKKINGKSVSDYSSFITSMINYQFGEGYNWSDEAGKVQAETSTNEWIEWLRSNMKNADWLMQSLDFTQIRDSKALVKILSDHGINQSDVGHEFLNNIIDDFNKSREAIQEGYQDSLKNIFNVDSWKALSNLGHYDLYKLFNNNISGHDNLELSQDLAENLQKNLAQYKKLQDNDQKVLAENYLKGLESSFVIIGAYNDEQQDAIKSIMTGVDWADEGSLQDAADSLRDLGPEYEDLAVQLELAATRFTTSLTTRVLELRDNAEETNKSIEKMMSQVGKATKGSDALENVNTMLQSYTGDDKDTLNFDSIYEWDKELGGYILTNKGIQVWLDSINSKNVENINKAEQELIRLKSIYGGTGEQGLIFGSSKGIDRQAVVDAITSAFTDEQGNLTITQEEVEAQTDAFMADYETLVSEFNNQSDLTWEQFIQKKKDALIINNEQQLESLKKMAPQEILAQIKSVDYKAITGGTSAKGTRATLEALLEQAGIDPSRLKDNFNDVWNDMLKGEFTSFNNLLKEFNVDAEIDNEDIMFALREEYNQYSSGLNEIFNTPIALWSDKTKEIAGIDNTTDLSQVDIMGVAQNFLTRINELVNLGVVTIDEQAAAVELVIKKRQEQEGIGKENTLYTGIKNNKFSASDLFKLGLIDGEGKFINGAEKLVKESAITAGEYEIIAEGSIASIIDQFSEVAQIVLHKESDEYKDALKTGASNAETQIEKNDIGKQQAEALTKLATGKKYDRIDLSSLPKEIQDSLDVDANGYYQILDEVNRDNLLMAMDAAKLSEKQAKETLENQKKAIAQKRNQFAGLKGITATTVSKQAAEAFVESIGADPSDVEHQMGLMGFVYDEWKEEFKAVDGVTENIRNRIEALKDINDGKDHSKEIAELETLVNDLEYNLVEGKQNDAIATILANYKEVTEEDIVNLEQAFPDQLRGMRDKIFTKNATTNKWSTDIEALLNALSGELNSAAQATVTEIAQSYFDGISTAANLMTSGTNSITEKQDFTKLYNELVKPETEATMDSLFERSEISQADVLSATAVKELANAAREKAKNILTTIYKDSLSLESINRMADAAIVEPLSKIKFESFAGGTENESDTAMLKGYLQALDITEDKINTIIGELQEGVFTTLKEAVPDLNISEELERSTKIANAQQYNTAIKELQAENGTLSESTQRLMDQFGFDKEIETGSNQALEYASQFQIALLAFISQGLLSMQDAAENAQAALQQQWKNKGYGKGQSVLDMFQDGLDISEISSYIDQWGGTVSTWFLKDQNGNILGLNGPISSVFEIDKFTGKIKAKKDATVAEILNSIMQQTGITLVEGTKEYYAAYSELVDSQIAESDNLNRAKRAKSQLESLISASAGETVNIYDIPQEIKDKLGVSGDKWTILDEAQRDSLILAIDATTISDEALKKQIDQAQSSIRSNRVTDVSGWESVIKDKVTENEARAFSMAYRGTEVYYKQMMEEIGYSWNEELQQFIAGNLSTKKIQSYLDMLKPSLTTESYNHLVALNRNLQDLQKYGPINAIRDVLSNYTNVSNEMIAEFNNQFADFDLASYVKADAQGNKVLNVNQLKADLTAAGHDISGVFSEELASIVDTYTSNISSAISMVTSGTTSIADIEKFIKQYQDVGFTGDTTTLFNYNEVVKAWTLDPAVLQDYIKRQAKQIEALGYDATAWYEDQIKSFANNVDINSYLSADDRSVTGDAFKELTNAMYQYFAVQGYNDELIVSIINQEIANLNAGGEAMIATAKRWAERQGKTLTDQEIDSMMSDSISKITDKYSSIIEELVNFTSHDNLSQVPKSAESKLTIAGEDVTLSAENSLEAAVTFLKILAEQIGKAGYSLEDYNATAKSILDKTLFKKGGNTKALVDFASGEIGTDALESLANDFGIQLDQLVDVASGQIIGNMRHYLSYNAASGAYEIQGTFNGFISALEKEFGVTIDRTSKQYVEAFKNFNDAQISKDHEIDKAVTEELKAITEVKPGEKLNLAQTYTILEQSMGENFHWFKYTLEKFGADFTDGILTIENGTDIQTIIQKLATEVTRAGAVLPEELAELNDALVQALRDIANMISNGIGGSISGEDMRSLTKWAENYGITDLQFIETADGYQLATESAKELYNTINDINQLQGQVVFEKLKDNLIETDERFKSVNSNAGYIAELSTKTTSEGQELFLQSLNGNVNAWERPVLHNADGSISTLLTATEESRNYQSDIPWVMNITPITPDGQKLSDTQLEEYIQKLVDESSGDMDKMIKLDKAQLGLIIEGQNTDLNQQDEILAKYDERAEYLHEIGALIEDIKASEDYNDKKVKQYREELALAQQIAEARGLTEDNSFKFMEQDIPSGQKNPLNYWENWSKAYQVMKDTTRGGKSQKGKMAYEDFYNLVTEMGNLASITGQSIQIGEKVKVNAENVASLIEQAAGALEVQSDGSLKVNLSKIGVDFATGADTMNENVADGIKAVSQSQVEMLDSLIGLLEAIVTMEDAFKGMDVDSDAKLSIGELFEVDDEGTATAFKDTWEKKLEDLRAMLDPKNLEKYNEDFARGMDSIKFTLNGKMMSLADVLKLDFEDIVGEGGMGADFYTKLMDSIYQAAQDGDFSEINIKEIIMQHLQEGLEGTGAQITFDLGNYTFIGTGSGNMQINWDTTAAEEAIKRHGKDKIVEAATKMLEGKAETTDIEMVLETNGVLYLKNKKWTVKAPDGTEYTKDDAGKGYEEALSAAVLKDVEGVENIHMDAKGTGRALGTVTMGETIFNVTSENGQITYSDANNTVTGTSPRDVISKLVEKQLDEEEAGARMAGASYDRESRKIELTYQAEVKAGIASFELNSQSYQTVEKASRDKLEAALRSGNAAEIEIAINADPKLASLKGLSSSEIEEKLGIKEIPIKINGNVEEANNKLDELQKKVKGLTDPTYTIKVETTDATNTAAGTLAAISEQLTAIEGKKTQDITVTTTYTNIGLPPVIPLSGKYQVPAIGRQNNGTVGATGNVGLAKAQGTLMGELGQEMVVSNGRYFVVGQDGPEFVDLDTDAIVFNHLQTEQLLKHGMSSTRGKAVTNEQNAVAFAKGSLNGGPAMASARAVLAKLKQLRAMWKSLGNTSASDLAGLGGGGGGGGGKDDAAARKSFIKDVERWYNWLQRIAVLEEKINEEEKKRAKYQANLISQGKEYATSNLKTLEYLKEQAAVNQALADSQQAYFEKRRADLNGGLFSKFYTFDEYGQLKYNDNELGFSFLADLLSVDDQGKPKYTLEEQYNALVAQGFQKYMEYDSSGNEIQLKSSDEEKGPTQDEKDSFYSSSLQALFDVMDGQKEEMQSLHDSIQEKLDAVTENQTQAYEILKEIEDNQIAVEERVLQAIEDMRQQEIDNLQDERDALEKSTNQLIDGLNTALQNEREMYERQQSQDELTTLQRQLAILQRTGGAASQIASLQQELSQKQQDIYFETQQAQIDALQEASDAQLEKLDQQISLMTEQLEYEKTYGLLWEDVYAVMQGTPEEITSFIQEYTQEFWGYSPTKTEQELRTALFEAEQFKTYQTQMKDGFAAMVQSFSDEAIKIAAAIEATKAADTGSDYVGTPSGGSSSSGSSGGSGGSGGGSGNGSSNTPVTTTNSDNSSTSTEATLQVTQKKNGNYGYEITDTKGNIVAKVDNSYASSGQAQMEAQHTADYIASLQGSSINKTVSNGKVSASVKTVPKVKVQTKDFGGMVERDGFEFVHAKEAVLTPRQTAILREQILSNKPTSLLSLLTDFRDAYNGISNASNYTTSNNNNSVVIEQATVEMHVSQIANDYDAQRAGEQALEKMLSIARKTRGQNRIGR